MIMESLNEEIKDWVEDYNSNPTLYILTSPNGTTEGVYRTTENLFFNKNQKLVPKKTQDIYPDIKLFLINYVGFFEEDLKEVSLKIA